MRAHTWMEETLERILSTSTKITATNIIAATPTNICTAATTTGNTSGTLVAEYPAVYVENPFY